MKLSVLFALSIFFMGLPAHAFPTALGPFPAPPLVPGQSTRIRALETEFKNTLPICIARLEDFFGKTWPTNSDGSFVGLQAALSTKGTACDNGEDAAAACTWGSGQRIQLALSLPYFLNGSKILKTTLCHEAVHAYFRKFLSTRQYSAVPTWFREGSAVALAGQADEYIYGRRTQSLETFFKPAADLKGLNAPASTEQYAEYALAFRYLDELRPDGAKRVIRAVFRGRSVSEAIQNETGLSLDEFIQQAKPAASRELHQLFAAEEKMPAKILSALHILRDGLPRYREAGQILRQEIVARGYQILADGQIQLSGRTLEPHEIMPWLGFALRSVAETNRVLTGETLAAWTPTYAALIGTVPVWYYGMGAGSVRYDWAWKLFHAKKWSEAHALFAQIYAEHLENPNLRLASTKGLASAYFEMRKYREALRWIEPDSEKFKDHELWLMHAISQYQIGNTQAGLREFRKLLHAIVAEWKREEYTERFQKITGVHP